MDSESTQSANEGAQMMDGAHLNEIGGSNGVGSAGRTSRGLKQHLSLNENRSIGLRAVTIHVQLCTLTMFLIALTAVNIGRPELIRSLI